MPLRRVFVLALGLAFLAWATLEGNLQYRTYRLLRTAFRPARTPNDRVELMIQESWQASRGPSKSSYLAGGAFLVGVNCHDPRETRLEKPTLAATRDMLEGILAERPDIRIRAASIGGQQGYLITAFVKRSERRVSWAMFQAPNGCHMWVQGPDDSPLARRICEAVLRSAKF